MSTFSTEFFLTKKLFLATFISKYQFFTITLLRKQPLFAAAVNRNRFSVIHP